MHPNSCPLHLRPRRGSTLIVVTMISSVILLLIGSMLSFALSERRMNIRHAARLEARNAAESLVEFGAAQIRQKYETRGSFTLNPNGLDALRQPPQSFWSGTNVVTTVSNLTGTSAPSVSSRDLELVGGTERTVATAGSPNYFFNPADPANVNDPLRNRWVNRRDVTVIARASVIPSTGGPPVSAYVGQTISIRGAPLFAHAIFYNMDLEIFNGPIMNIPGPVHTNGNLYVYPNAQLNFRGNVTATGKIFKAKKPGDNTSDGNSAAGRNGSINFLNRAGTLVNLQGQDATINSGPAFWRDATGGTGTNGTSFANFAANASQVWNGFLQTGDHGIQNYTPAAIGRYVEDPTPNNGVDNSVNTGRLIIEPPRIPSTSDANYALKLEVEKQKYSNMAGIYITVNPDTRAITAESRGLNDDQSFKPVKTLTLPTNDRLIKYNAYVESVGSAGVVVDGGMYDHHRGKALDLVEVDIQALREVVVELQKTGGFIPQNALGNLAPSDWNGIIYVDVLGGPTTRVVDESSFLPAGSTIAGTMPRNDRTSVRLINGAGRVPTFGKDPGLTVASNAPIYVRGHYNADGITASNSATLPEAGEQPAAIVSDAITVLSPNFDDKSSRRSRNPSSTGTVEVAAAFLMGISPTNKNGTGNTSGGAHNIVRFLEDWGSHPTWFRGSLVSLFESRVFTEPHGNGYYSPPVRNWGFNQLFANGVYPPGTPRVLSYARVNFVDMTAAEYKAARDSYNWR